MEIKGIKYTAPLLDNSGYAQAARGNILALNSLGIPLTLNPITFESARPDLGEHGHIIKNLVGNNIDYNINFIHTTPEFWPKYKEEGKLNIGYTIWETTKLHPDWPKYINESVDAVMVGCEWNVGVFRESGVTVPIFTVPHGISKDAFDDIKPFNIKGVDPKAYTFYSIFQWVERKHPLALIKAYWHAFQKEENVALILKTYRSDYSDAEKDAIRTTIRRLKQVTPMDNYPPIYLILNMLSEGEMLGLHSRGGCYVSLDRGEGFGLSPFTAGACGNPIAVTGFGGSTEYAKPDNSYLVDYSLTPVFGMPWSSSIKSVVYTRNGHKQIKDITENDVVVNKNGNLKNVIKVGNRDLLPAEMMHSIKYMSMFEALEVTNKHRLYVMADGKKIKKNVDEIHSGDYIIIPKSNTVITEGEIDLLNYVYSDRWTCVGNKLYCRNSKNGNLSINRFVKLSDDLFWLIGIYLAEGCVYNNNDVLSFSFNIDEINTIVSKCRDLLIKVFGVDSSKISVREYSDRRGCELYLSSLPISNFFMETFSTGSKKKRIPYKWKLNDVKSFRENLLIGYWLGDGHVRNFRTVNNKNMFSHECVATTSSIDLVLDLRDLLISLEILPSLTKNTRKDGRISYIVSVNSLIFDKLFGVLGRTKSDSSFHYYKLIDGDFAARVKSNKVIENFEGNVYSISVDPDDDEDIKYGGSYVLNGIASSNSPWYRGDQLWAEPDVKHGADTMVHIFDNQEEAKEKGQKIKKYIADNFDWKTIGQKIIDGIKSL